MYVQLNVSHLLVVHVAGAADERGPAFRMELQGGDAVPSVSLSRDLWSQNFQAVSGRQTCENKVSDTFRVCLDYRSRRRPQLLPSFKSSLVSDLLDEDGSCWSRFPGEEFQLTWTLTCPHLQSQQVQKKILFNLHTTGTFSSFNNLFNKISMLSSVGTAVFYLSDD